MTDNQVDSPTPNAILLATPLKAFLPTVLQQNLPNNSTMINNKISLQCFLLAFISLQAVIPVSAAGCAGTSSAVVSALLPLHTGADCTTLQLRGLQQLAALRAVVNEINNEMKAQDGLTLGLQIQDTCNNPEGAMRAALRSLVDAQQTCSNPPLYLGMMGPEDAESLARVKGVSKVFNATHILPTFHSVSKESEENSVFFVSIERMKEQAQSVLTVVKQLNWQSFSLTFEEPMAEQADVLIKSAKDNGLCVRGSVTRFDLKKPVPKIFTGNQDGVVVLVDSHQAAAQVLRAYRGLTTPLVLLVRTVGLEAWQVPRSATNLYLLQQVSPSDEGVPETINATLKQEYEGQRQAEFQDVHCKDMSNAADCALEGSSQDKLPDDIDVSVAAMANGVRLLGAALKAVHKARCGSGPGSTPVFGICPKLMALTTVDWRNALRRATTVIHSTRVRFLMELPTSFHVYTRDNAAGDLDKVATLVAGNLKELAEGFIFPSMAHASNITACGATPVVPIAPPLHAATPATIAPPTGSDDGPTLRDIYSSEYSFYELIGMICGVGFIMFALMVVIIYLIYNNLVEKTEKESTGGSLETVRSSRPPRKNLKDNFRRNSSFRASNRS